MLLFLVTASLAGPKIVSVGAPLLVDGSGNWPRIFPKDDGTWSLLTANQSGLIFTALDASFNRTAGSFLIVDDDSLLDHSFSQCPDGTILHIGMGTRTTQQHTATARRFSADWTLLSETVVIDNDPKALIVDQGAVCGENFQGFGYLHNESALDGEARFFLFDSDDHPVADPKIADVFNPVGMSALERDGKLYLISSNAPDTGSLRIVTLDTSLAQLDDHQVPLVADPGVVYWPQAAMDVDGDTFVVYITQAVRNDWSGQFGDVHLLQFDRDWNILEDVGVYALGPGYGGFQPGLALRDAQLVVSYGTEDHTNHVVVVTLDRAEEDTGTVDTGGGGDTGDTAVVEDSDSASDTSADTADSAVDVDTGDTDMGVEGPDKSGCECGHTSAPAALGLLAVAALARRRGQR